LLLLHLLRLHLLHQRGAAAGDLPHPDLERQRAVLGEAGRRRTGAERELLRHREAIFAAFLHPGHRLGKAGIDLVHGEGLRTAVGFAAVDDIPVVRRQDIIEEGSIVSGDRFALARLDGPELEPALSDNRAKRAGADPSEADPGGDENQEREPQHESPACMGGTIGGFSGGHCFRLGAQRAPSRSARLRSSLRARRMAAARSRARFSLGFS